MSKHLYAHRKTSDRSASISQQSSQFQPRPFVVQPQTEEQSEQPDFKTALERAKLYGHSLDRIKSIKPSVPAPIPRIVQAKLTIGQPGDRYEQEADRVAAQVVNQIHAPTTQRQELPEEDEELQMKPSGGGMAAAPDLEPSIQQARGSGQPLADSIREPMEQAFGADFSSVKVHTDGQSDQLNQSIQAKAFTTGQDVFFRQGEYNPGNRDGQELLAHELTHIVQQNESTVQQEKEEKSILMPTKLGIQMMENDSNSENTNENITVETGQLLKPGQLLGYKGIVLEEEADFKWPPPEDQSDKDWSGIYVGSKEEAKGYLTPKVDELKGKFKPSKGFLVEIYLKDNLEKSLQWFHVKGKYMARTDIGGEEKAEKVKKESNISDGDRLIPSLGEQHMIYKGSSLVENGTTHEEIVIPHELVKYTQEHIVKEYNYEELKKGVA